MNVHQPINPDWTEAEVETLLNMRGRGYSASQIGAAIGKTRNAVLGKAKRLKLEKLSTSPGRRGKVGGRVADAVKRRDGITSVILVEAIASRNIPLTELDAYHCRYITAGEGADARYCGCVTKPGKSWCAGHYSRVFRKADARELA